MPNPSSPSLDHRATWPAMSGRGNPPGLLPRRALLPEPSQEMNRATQRELVQMSLLLRPDAQSAARA